MLLDCVKVQRSARELEDHIQAIQVLNCSSKDLRILCVCVLSARLCLELSECKVCLPCAVILECIKLYKVRRKPWDLSGSLANVFNPPTWCGATRTLCARGVETPFLAEEPP
jgi:hypothetical protein